MGPLQILFVFIGAIVLTIIVEITVAILMGYKQTRMHRLIVWINLITNPMLNLLLVVVANFAIFFSVSDGLFHRWAMLIPLELAIIFIENHILYYVYRSKYTLNTLFKLALTMNACSFIVGEIIYLLIFY